jgi:hypothetical protein
VAELPLDESGRNMSIGLYLEKVTVQRRPVANGRDPDTGFPTGGLAFGEVRGKLVVRRRQYSTLHSLDQFREEAVMDRVLIFSADDRLSPGDIVMSGGQRFEVWTIDDLSPHHREAWLREILTGA